MYVCPYCKLFKAKLLLTVLNHLRIHESEPRFSITCGISGCKQAYSITESLKKHLYRKHRDVLQPNNDGSTSRYDDNEWYCFEETSEERPDIFVAEESLGPKQTFDRAKALFILKIREERRLPQVSYIFLISLLLCIYLFP